jgi:hypothetical protein
MLTLRTKELLLAAVLLSLLILASTIFPSLQYFGAATLEALGIDPRSNRDAVFFTSVFWWLALMGVVFAARNARRNRELG